MKRSSAVAVLGLFCSTAFAWTSYTDDPRTEFGSGYGTYGPFAGQPPYSMFDVPPIPESLQPDRGAHGPAPVGARSGKMQMSQERSDDAYTLVIQLEGIEPDSIEVRAAGQSLVVSTRVDASRSRTEQSDDGYGYRRSYSFSSGRSSRRLPVPPDGDLSAFEREDAESQVRVSIPRRQPAQGMR